MTSSTDTPFDPFEKWFGIAPEQQPPNHYVMLGLKEFESDSKLIDDAVEKRAMFLQDVANGPHTKASQELLNLVAQARLCLVSPERKREYDEQLRNPVRLAKPIPMAIPIDANLALEDLKLALEDRKTNSDKQQPDSKVHNSGPTRTKKKTWLAIPIGAAVCLAAVLIGLFWWNGPSKQQLAKENQIANESALDPVATAVVKKLEVGEDLTSPTKTKNKPKEKPVSNRQKPAETKPETKTETKKPLDPQPDSKTPAGRDVATAKTAIAPITSVDTTTISGSPDQIQLDSFTVGGVTYNTTDLVTGTSVKTSSIADGTRIGNQDNFDFNLYFGRGGNPSHNTWTTSLFGGANWSNTNGNDADFFIFEAGGNDSISVRPIFTDNSVGQYVELSTKVSEGGPVNWGNTNVVITEAERTGNDIYGLAFAITDLKDLTGDALTNSTVIKGLDFDGPGTDIASVSAVAPPATVPKGPGSGTSPKPDPKVATGDLTVAPPHAEHTAALKRVAPGFSIARQFAGRDGGKFVDNYRGRPAFVSHPRTKNEACVMERVVTLPAGAKTVLHFGVLDNASGDAVFEVRVNGRVLLNRTVDRLKGSDETWLDEKVDLGAYAGQHVKIEFVHKAGGANQWFNEHLYWSRIELVPAVTGSAPQSLGKTQSALAPTAQTAVTNALADGYTGPYRIAFVTTGKMKPTSSDISTYNIFVTTAAGLVTELNDLGATWKCLGSTVAVSARVNTSTDSTGDANDVPIYTTNGKRIATNNADLWDGTILNPIYFDDGTVAGEQTWTGTNADGTSASSGDGRELGTGPSPNNIRMVRGGHTDAGWISGPSDHDGSAKHYLALSGVISGRVRPLMPVKVESKFEINHKINADGSIEVDDKKSAAGDQLTVTFETRSPNITALRFEALPFGKPGQGPGRNSGGMFSITEMKIIAEPISGASGPIPITFKKLDEDQVLPGMFAAGLFDDKPTTLWGCRGRAGVKRILTLIPDKPIVHEGGVRITMVMDQKMPLGKFHLMSTASADATVLATPKFSKAPTRVVRYLNFGTIRDFKIKGTNWEGTGPYKKGGFGYIGNADLKTEDVGNWRLEDPLIKSYMEANHVRVDLPNGKYKLRLLFTDLVFDEPGQREFEVTIEGKPLAANVDVVKLAKGKGGVFFVDVSTEVWDGHLDIRLKKVNGGEPIINALRLISTGRLVGRHE